MTTSKRGRVCGRYLALAAMALGLSGCFGGGGGGGGLGGPVPLTLYEAVFSANAGTDVDPYVLPRNMPSGTNGGIEDYFARGGVWDFWFAARTGYITAAGAFSFDQGNIVYNTADGTWTLPTSGANYTLTADGSGRYQSSGCTAGGDCITLYVHDADPVTSQYGTFALAMADNGTGEIGFMVEFGGLRTYAVAVPARGAATYSGAFEGYGNRGKTIFELSGTTDLVVDFSGATLTMSTVGTVAGHPDGADAFSLSGSAPIEVSASAYGSNGFLNNGGMTGGITSSGTLLASYSGDIWGAFFGPDAVEAVGMVGLYDTSIGGSERITGGFWTQQTSFTP